MKLLNIIFCILFIISAVLQYNDPDPYLWIPIYLVPAWFCFQAIKGKFYPVAYLVVSILLIGYAMYLLISTDGVISWATEHEAENIAQSMKATRPWIESTREFFGLLIILVSILANYIYYKRNRSGGVKPGPTD